MTANYADLQAQIAALQAQAAQLLAKEQEAAINTCMELIKRYAIKAPQLGFNIGAPRQARIDETGGEKKFFIDPNNQKNIWSGFGPQPQWVKEYLANGGQKADLKQMTRSEILALPDEPETQPQETQKDETPETQPQETVTTPPAAKKTNKK